MHLQCCQSVPELHVKLNIVYENHIGMQIVFCKKAIVMITNHSEHSKEIGMWFVNKLASPDFKSGMTLAMFRLLRNILDHIMEF